MLLLVLVLLALVGPGAVVRAESSSAEHWEQVRSDHGIITWTSERPGQVLSPVRARTIIEASLWEVVAVLEDVNRACEWTAHCLEMRRVSRLSERAMLVYARMNAPWPVHDRDVVTRVSVFYGSPGELGATIESVEVATVPKVADVVRMPKMSARYQFRVLDEKRVEVEYQADVDPGGALPDWLKRLVVKDLAHDTVGRLRDRTLVTQRHGTYRARAAELEGMALRSGFVASVAGARRGT